MYQIILCSCPDQSSAETLADSLISGHLAACVNIVPGLTSVYLWQGAVEKAQEVLLLIKSQSQHYEAIEAEIKAHHPYGVPEIVALDIARGSADYLQWIDSCLSYH